MTNDKKPHALGHLRVLDLSRVLAGPWCGQILGDLGAEVLKIENPNGGDDTRKWGPPFLPETAGGSLDAAYYSSANRNKRSLAIDISTPEGADVVRDLARECDIVIENFKVGGLAKYGIDYAGIKEVRPDVIYCSITGFGQTGPYATRAGYDYLIQGMSGLMSVTGLPDGVPGGGPMRTGVAVCDLYTGMYATVSILAALAHRDATGEGQYIDCALLDCQIAALANQTANYLASGEAPARMGNSHPNVVPYRVYPVKDGHVIIAVGNDGQFQRMCAALDMPEQAKDPRFATASTRIVNRDPLDAAIEASLARFGRDEIIALLEKATVPCGPINDLSDTFADPQVQARELVVTLPRGGTEVKTVGFPAKLSRTPADYRLAPPELGIDTRDVLARVCGYDDDRLAQLQAAGTVGTRKD